MRSYLYDLKKIAIHAAMYLIPFLAVQIDVVSQLLSEYGIDKSLVIIIAGFITYSANRLAQTGIANLPEDASSK